jgi:hypothetical protein
MSQSFEKHQKKIEILLEKPIGNMIDKNAHAAVSLNYFRVH